jgi:hypothetical protein
VIKDLSKAFESMFLVFVVALNDVMWLIITEEIV